MQRFLGAGNAVLMMAKIVVETEEQIRLDPPPVPRRPRTTRLSVAETICECMAHSAEDLNLAAIAIFTESGHTARLLSKYRPEPPIFALSPDEAVINRAMMLWGTSRSCAIASRIRTSRSIWPS
jgi:pyruvate kinase